MTDTIGYVRVSTEQQATDSKLSLGDQRRLITEFAGKLGRVVARESIFEDPGVSGATAEGRPGFMAMLAFCEANPVRRAPVGMVIVLNDARFGRFDDPEEATHWRFVLKRLGWHVRFVDSDEVQDPTARSVVRIIHSAQASEYRANLRRTAKRAARATAEQGRWQQEAPFGYRRLATRTDGAQRVLEIGQRKSADEYSRLTPGPEHEQEILRWLFQSYASGTMSLGELARQAALKFPGRAWSKVTVGATIRNPAYVGDVIWCRRVTDKAERQERTVRSRDEWVIVRDAHPALVSRELFQTVQERLAQNKRHTRATSGDYLLTGIITCAECGRPFTGGGGKKGPPDDPERFRFYKDSGAVTRIPECKGRITTLNKRWIEGAVVDVVSRHVAGAVAQEKIADRTRELVMSARGGSKERRAALERDRTKVLLQRSRLVASIAAGTVQEKEAASLMAEIRSRVEAIESEIEKSRFADRATASLAAECERLIETAKDFPALVKRLSGPQLRELLRPWIYKAVVDKEKRVLNLYLWQVLGADKVLQLDSSPERGSQDETLKRFTIRRRIALPPRPAQFIALYNRRRAAGGAR